MLRGIYSSALSMVSQMNKLNVITNNIANVDTTGYKKDTAITQAFSEELTKRINDKGEKNRKDQQVLLTPNVLGNISLGVYVQNINTDFSRGAFKETKGELDFAIDGDGFFRVNNPASPDGVSYTRDGTFTLTLDRRLINSSGYEVLGEDGVITLPEGEFKIDEDGNIYIDDEFITRLTLIDVSNKTTLSKVGDNLYDTTADSNITATNAKLKQGFKEASNVKTVTEMVEMISVSRAYEANQRVITTLDTTLGRAVNDIARKI